MFLRKNQKIAFLESEVKRLKEVIFLKDVALNQSMATLEEETKLREKLSGFRIRMLEALGLIGVHGNDELALNEIKKLVELKQGV